VAILLQRRSASRRVYARILNAKNNTDGHKEAGVIFPSAELQQRLHEEAYAEAGVDPKDVEYFEAHATGTKIGDRVECKALAGALCKDRNEVNPLWIGSVKSFIGHTEPASGLCGIAKIITAIQTGIIPKTLHFTTPNPEISGIAEGKLKVNNSILIGATITWAKRSIKLISILLLQVLAENTKWNRGLVGVGSYGWGGANVTAILEPHASSTTPLTQDQWLNGETKDITLIPFYGRTKEAVAFGLDQILNMDKEKMDGVASLLHKLTETDVPRFDWRGFVLVDENANSAMDKMILQSDTSSKNRELCFVFSGVGGNLDSLEHLLELDVVRNSLEKSSQVLDPFGLDLMKIFTTSENRDIVTNFVSIIAVQVNQ